MVEDGLRMVSDEFYFAQVLRARVARGCGLHAQRSFGSRLGKQVMSRTCELRHSALSEYSIL